MNHTAFRQARRTLGLSASQLGRIIDVSPQTIRKWEADETRATTRAVNPIAARAMQWMLAGFRPPEFPPGK